MAKPKHMVAIDFDKDGDFNGANEEITADVRVSGSFSYKIHRGVNLRKYRVEASVLELFLNNNDHTYSPFYPLSPLNDPATNTSVFPAPNIWFMMGYPVDDFNAANGTDLDGRTPSHDDNFDAWAGDTTDFEVDTNQLKASSATNLTAVLDFGESDCFVGCKFTRGSTASGIVVRWSDASNFLLVRHDGTNISVDKVEAGSMTNVAQAAFTWTAGTQHWLLVELHGDDIHTSVDNDLILSTSSSFNNTATRHGIGGRATHANDRWDDFGGWRSLFYGRIDSISPRPEVNNQYTYLRAFDDMERQNIHQVYRVAPIAPTTAEDVIDEILDAVGFDAGNRILDTGETLTHAAQHQKSMGRVGLIELYQVQDDDVGLYYLDGSGYARYEGSDHRAAAPHTTARQTWHTSRQAGDETDIYIGQRFEWNDGKEGVENEVWYFYDKISEVTSGIEVWRLNDTSAILDDRPAIANGETLSFLAIGDGDVIASPITPVATTDYLVNTQEDGAGTNLTGSVASALVTGFEGNFRLITLTNNSGSDGFVTFLRLRATQHTRSAKAGARAENTLSQIDNGRRRIEHITLHIDEYNTALDRAQKRITLRARPKERLTVDMENGSRANLMQILHRSISDKVDLVYDSLSIINSFHIEGSTITGQEGGLYINCAWELQEAFGGGWGFNKWQASASDEGAFQWA